MIRPILALLVTVFVLPRHAAAQALTPQEDAPRISAVVVEPPPADPGKRPALLIGMYVASGVLHGYDAYSTLAGVSANAAEANPIVGDMAKQPALFIAAKSAMALTTMAAADQMWRSGHRGRAIALMAVSNGVMAIVAAHNAAVLRGQR